MATLTAPPPATNAVLDGLVTVADLVAHLGGIPPHRIRLRPLPGTADEHDVAHAKGCELVDGIVVEKAMGFYESRLGAVLVAFLEMFLMRTQLGFTLEGEALVQVAPGRVRRPDVSVYLWERFPNHVLPPGQILRLLPDLAVEILSPANTEAEMDRKREEYFQGGVHRVWQVYPLDRCVRVYTALDDFLTLGPNDELDGGDLLPGFRLLIQEWFDRAGRQSER